MNTKLILRQDGGVVVQWDGTARDDLFRIDHAGYVLLRARMDTVEGLNPEVVRSNMQLFLQKLLNDKRHDFNRDGSIFLDESCLRKLLSPTPMPE